MEFQRGFYIFVAVIAVGAVGAVPILRAGAQDYPACPRQVQFDKTDIPSRDIGRIMRRFGEAEISRRNGRDSLYYYCKREGGSVEFYLSDVGTATAQSILRGVHVRSKDAPPRKNGSYTARMLYNLENDAGLNVYSQLKEVKAIYGDKMQCSDVRGPDHSQICEYLCTTGFEGKRLTVRQKFEFSYGTVRDIEIVTLLPKDQ